MGSPWLGLGAALMVTAVCSAETPSGAEWLQQPKTISCAPAPLTCEELVALGYAYPYAREPGSYLFINGAAYPYVELSNDLLAHSSVQVGSRAVAVMKLLQTLGLADRLTRQRTPVIGYGSNAAVSALTRKFVSPAVREPAVIPVTRALLRDYDVVWSPHLAFNGAMPATIARSRGTVVEVWITGRRRDDPSPTSGRPTSRDRSRAPAPAVRRGHGAPAQEGGGSPRRGWTWWDLYRHARPR
jgi:hypothetical protein